MSTETPKSKGEDKKPKRPKIVPSKANTIGANIRKSAGKSANRKRKQILKNSLADKSISQVSSLNSDEGAIFSLKLIDFFHKHKIGRTLRKRKDDKEEPVKSSMSLLVVGVNSVTKCLEKNEASLVIVDNSVQPPIIVSHLFRQAEIYKIPVISVDINNIKTCLNVQSLTTVAFKELNSYDESVKEDLLEIFKLVPNSLNPTSTSLNPTSTSLNPTSITCSDLPIKTTTELSVSDELTENKTIKLEPTINPQLSLPPLIKPELKLKLPADDIDFTALYKYRSKKGSSVFTADFLKFSEETFTDTNTSEPRIKLSKVRYHNTEIGVFKNDPDRKRNVKISNK